MAQDGPNAISHLSMAPLESAAPAGLSSASQRLARCLIVAPWLTRWQVHFAMIRLSQVERQAPREWTPPSIGLQGPQPASARGHLASRTLPYGRERYKFRWPLVMCLEEVAAVLRARPCKMAVAAGCFLIGQPGGRAGRVRSILASHRSVGATSATRYTKTPLSDAYQSRRRLRGRLPTFKTVPAVASVDVAGPRDGWRNV